VGKFGDAVVVVVVDVVFYGDFLTMFRFCLYVDDMLFVTNNVHSEFTPTNTLTNTFTNTTPTTATATATTTLSHSHSRLNIEVSSMFSNCIAVLHW